MILERVLLNRTLFHFFMIYFLLDLDTMSGSTISRVAAKYYEEGEKTCFK